MKILFLNFGISGGVVKTLKTRGLEIFSVLSLLLPGAAGAAPLMINYQGRLVNTAGNPLAGPLDITFRIYDAAGVQQWTETQTAIYPDNGIFSVSLGSFTPLSASVFSSDASYLGVTIAGDPEMAPRTRLLSTPYALYTANLGSSGAQAVISTDVVVAASQLRLGNFAALPGAIGPGALAYNSASNRVNFWNGSVWSPLENGGVSPWSSASGLVYLGNIGDNVGVGTAVPLYKLHVAGTIKSDFGVNASTMVITGTGAAALDVAGGINAGTDNISIVDATGRLPALSAAYLADLNGGNLTGILSSSLSGTVPPALINLSTVTTALAGKLSSMAGIPAALVDLSTVTTALGLKADAASVLPANATVPQALINLSTVTTALAGKLSSTAGVPAALVDLSTVTTALGLKADAASVLPANATVPQALINLSTVTTALAGKLSSTAGVPAALVDLSTVTTALGLKADAASVLPANATVPSDLIDLSTVTTALAGKLSSTAGVPAALVDLSTAAGLGANTFTGSQTITASGGLAVTYGIAAGTVTLTGGITASSATFMGNGEVRGVIKAGSGAVQITNAAGNLDATKLTGNLPAINGASLTGVIAASVALITSASCDALDAASVGLFCYDTSDNVVSVSTSTGVGGYASFTAGAW